MNHKNETQLLSHDEGKLITTRSFRLEYHVARREKFDLQRRFLLQFEFEVRLTLLPSCWPLNNGGWAFY